MLLLFACVKGVKLVLRGLTDLPFKTHKFAMSLKTGKFVKKHWIYNSSSPLSLSI